MKRRIGNRLMELFIVLALACAAAAVVPRAYAGMIASDAAQAPAERERVKTMLERPAVAGQLESMGIRATNAAARVDALSDAEVAQVAGRIDALATGGAALTNEQVLIIALVVVILIVAL